MLARKSDAPRIDPLAEGEFDEFGVPPTTACARCGRFDCLGCAPPTREEVASRLDWERPGGSNLRSLFVTAERTALDPVEVFTELGRPSGRSLGGALWFATLSELFALASLAVFGSSVLYVFAPSLVRELFSSSTVWLLTTSVWLGLAFVMVVIHVLWGLSLELGVRSRGTSPDFRASLRFGFYSCGWDLLTSPVGILWGIVARSEGRLDAVWAAARVPRRALDAYLGPGRGLDDSTRKRALLTSVIAFTIAFALVLLASVVGFLYWVHLHLG